MYSVGMFWIKSFMNKHVQCWHVLAVIAYEV